MPTPATSLTTVRDLEPYEIELEETGDTFVPDEALVKASAHEVWLFYLYVAGCDAAQVARDLPRCGLHIRVQNALPERSRDP
jgi:hypothetical protein